MNHRIPLAIVTLALLLVANAFGASKRTNIIFIFADDWGWGDLGCHGHSHVKTPNIDRLAEEGTDFHRFTVASGVCSPSRTAVMTGHFPARYNIDGHFAWVDSNAKRNMPDWLDPQAPLLPRMLQEAGYATAHFGKWHLANNMIPDSPLPEVYGYDEYGAFNCAGEQMPVHEDAMHAISFMEKSVAAEKPFFINLWMHEPHTPFHVVPKYQWRFRDLDEADNIYASVLSHADDRIGEVLDALDRLGVTDNTLVVFSSDNGPARSSRAKELELTYDSATGAGYGIGAAKGVTGGRKGYKGALFEGGIGVPFIARWPGKIAAGKVDDRSLISAVDLLPTFCEVAGVDLPESYEPDGVSQVSVLKGTAAPRREKALFWKMNAAWPAPRHAPDHWVSYAVVQDQWKLVSNRDGSHVELYDLAVDGLEKKDVAGEQPEAVRGLTEKLSGWKATLPAAPPARLFSAGRKRVVCFGDSITKRGYPEHLARMLGVEAVNAGVAGNSSAQALRRMEEDVLEKEPDVVVLFFGTNDGRVDAPKVHVPVEKYRKNLEEMVERSRKAGAEVVLCTLPPIHAEAYLERHENAVFDKAGGLEALVASYREAALRVGREKRVPVVDLNQLLREEARWMHPDGVHPSAEGCRIIARMIAEKVRPLVAETRGR